MADLKTNYKNDVLDVTMGGKRRYEQVENSDGTVSLVDKTVYTQVGDNLGADDINAQNTAINTINNNLQTLSNEFNYSTTEEISIGKWVNGNTIKRKVIQTPNITINENTAYDISSYFNSSNKIVLNCYAISSEYPTRAVVNLYENTLYSPKGTWGNIDYLVCEYVNK